MQLNYLAIILATAVEFFLGFLWYGPLFGKLWGKMHGFDMLPKETQDKMMQSMGPFYGLQALVTLITTVVLAILLAYQPTWNAYVLTLFFWIGFVVPTQVSAVVFGGTKPEWMVKKISLMAGASLLCLEAATVILHWWK